MGNKSFLTRVRMLPYLVRHYLLKWFNSNGKYTLISSRSLNSLNRLFPCTFFSSRLSSRSSKKLCISLTFLVINLCLLYWSGIFRRRVVYRIYNEDILTLARIGDVRCNFPQLKPFSPDIFPFLKKSISIKCAYASNGVEQAFSVNHKNQLVKLRDMGRECCYRTLSRANDQNNLEGKECIPIKKNVTKIAKTHDFIELFCVSGDGPDYKDIFPLVHKKPKVEERIKNFEKDHPSVPQEEKLSVIVLGFDSTSHMHFLRQMPETMKYLKGKLKDRAIPLNGFTKVGENTLPNVVPLLTGLNLNEFKAKCTAKHEEKKRREDREKVFLDKCQPLIWNQFAESGFRTSFAEDEFTYSIFNFAWRYAFDQAPTDYYLRPLANQVHKHHFSAEGYCFGSRLSFQVLLDNIGNTAHTFSKPHQKYFIFSWAAKLIHDVPNNINLGDEPLQELLQTLEEGHHLNRSIFIMTADHGSRVESIRLTPQGQLEDRMPLTYFIFPEWFSRVYPKAMDNFRVNSNRLTTAFDLHETLLDLIDPSKIRDEAIQERVRVNEEGLSPEELLKRRREPKGSSLFLQVPENRTCFSAKVPLQWCVCNDRESLSKVSPIVEDGAYFIVESLNALLDKEGECSPLDLVEINDAVKWKVVGKPLQTLGKGAKSGEKAKEETRLDPKYGESRARVERIKVQGSSYEEKNVEALILQITVITDPGGGIFEATILKNPADGKWILTERIARINRFGDQGYCAKDSELREYCFCENNTGPLSFLN